MAKSNLKFLINFRVPFEKKVQFTEQVRRLTNDGLTKLVKKCKDLCPAVLEDVDAEKLHIKVDDIGKDHFDILTKLVEENLNTGGKHKDEPARKRQRTD